MIRHIFLYFFILVGFSAIGQNLVPNGSFEDYSVCPTSYSQQNAIGWYDFGSSDYFNSCNNSINGIVGVPSNFIGSQVALNGNAYAGIICYFSATFGGREFLKVKLTEQLESGQVYCISFFVSLADSSAWAVDSIGAFISDTNFVLNPQSYPIPQVISNNNVVDKQNWVLIQGEYVANGNEQLLTIGNFSPRYSNDNYYVGSGCAVNIFTNPDCVESYYYVDSVSVTLCPDPASPPTESNITIPNVFTPNGDGINDLFLIETTAIESMSCEIFNRWGIKVATLSRLNEGWDGRTTSGQEATEGVYYYVLTAKGTDSKEYRKTGFLHLIR